VHQDRSSPQHPSIYACREGHGVHIRSDDVVIGRQAMEPILADLSQYPTLIRDPVGQDMVKGTDPVGTDHQQMLTQNIHVTNLAAPDGEA